MESKKRSNYRGEIAAVICKKCKKVQREKNGIYYCATPGCEGGFMLPSTRRIAQETLERVRRKHDEYANSEYQLPLTLNDPHYERFLQAFTDYKTWGLLIEKDLNATYHSTDFRAAMHYLEFFQAAEYFEKMLDHWKTNREEQS